MRFIPTRTVSQLALGRLFCPVHLAGIAISVALLVALFSSSAAAHTGGYDDVPANAYYTTPVAELDRAGVFDGTQCRDGDFCPDEPIDRATVAVWIVRILDGQDPPGELQSRFDDVDCCLPAFYPPFIERLAQLGVTGGCGDGSGYCPNRTTTRAEMAAFLSRAFNLSDGPDPGFSDVPDDAWYAADVARLAASGITAGCEDGTRFCPARVTTRAEMATFLYRAQRPDRDSSHDVLDPDLAAPLSYVDFERIDTLELTVYYCGRSNTEYTSSHLAMRIQELNAVDHFFRRQSGFQEQIEFVQGQTNGGILSPPGIEQYTTLSQWSEHRVDRDCLEATGDPNNKRVLILAGARGGGYAVQGDFRRSSGGPAVVAIPENRGSDTNHLGVVAHEIAHGFYDLQHPWLDHPALCDSIDHSRLFLEDRTFCQDHTSSVNLKQTRITHLLESLLSYMDFGAKFDLAPNAAYIACYQRAMSHLRWIDPGECEDYRASTPAAPFGPILTPEVRSLIISWSAPEGNGAEIDDYDVQFRSSSSEAWIDWPHDGTSRHARITGLTAGTTYQVRVQAWNRIGPSGWSPYGEAAPLHPENLPRRVILTRGDRVQGHSGCTSDACYWLHVEIENFPPGSHTLACAHNGVHQIGAARGVYHSAVGAVSNDSSSTRDCFFGFPGNEVFVVVGAELRDGTWHGGTHSNVVQWDDPTPPPPPGAILNDSPVLVDDVGEYTWWKPPADIDRFGYGDNGFHFTLAIGNDGDDSMDNWAAWEFGSAEGSYDVQVWLPAEWATAHVQYLIWADGNGDGEYGADEFVAGPWLDQQAVNVSGWQSLGVFDLDGAVRIEVRDTRARDDYRDVGTVNARLAVDAIQMLPTGDRADPTEIDTETAEELSDDSPVLVDDVGEYTWWKPPADIDRFGYGDNGFHFTLAIGNDGDDSMDNWAAWEFGSAEGSYDVQVWLPAEWATAHVQYLIWADGNGDGEYGADEFVAGPWLDQQAVNVSGWQSLGVFDLDGAVRIEVRDTRARDDYRDVGTVNARLAVDAIRLRRVS